MTDRALGAFLRARRESVPPGAVGLPSGPGRRTPGLRRAELAGLAGVSVEYLTRLERGLARRPSPEVLAALAGALRLAEDEHVHLLRLVKATGGDGACAVPDRSVRPTVRAVLDRLDDGPALVLDRCGEVLARTTGTTRLGLPDVANVPRFVVTDPLAGTVLPDRGAVADEWAARLRSAADLGDAGAAALATELALTPGSGFGPRYAGATRVPAWSGTERWSGPDGAVRTWAYEAFEMPGTAEHRLVVYTDA